MRGFDPEFASIDQYIRVITDRVWEGRRIEDIARYYSAECAVETPAGVTIGIEPVIASTRATLAAFPDRRLLAEDIIVSGDDTGGFLSSHRIFSPMTHAGDGPFGAPSLRPVHVRTIADCVCIDNRIVHEWLVRDQGAIARQIGSTPRELAATWLRGRGGFHKPPMPAAPSHYRSKIDPHPQAQTVGRMLRAIWDGGPIDRLASCLAPDVISALPGGEVAVGVQAVGAFWQGLRACFEPENFTLEHLVANERPGRCTAVAARWRLNARHAGPGHFGEPGGRRVELMAISHAELDGGRIVREWHLIDEVALWMQVLDGAGGHHGPG